VVTVDPRALVLGATVAAAIAVPIAAIGSAVTDDGGAGAIAFGLAALLGFLVGGWSAAARAGHAALLHGTLAALIAAVVVQGVVAAIHLAGDDDVDLASLIVNALLATSLGLAGGWLAERRSSPTVPA
jgi:hypothetical protein